MARGGSTEFGSVGSAYQFRYLDRAAGRFAVRPVQPVVRAHRYSVLLLALCLFVFWTALSSIAQTDDVHITPRETKKTDVSTTTNDPSGISDPTLRTHTKPLKKE